MNIVLYIDVQEWHKARNLTNEDNLLVQSMKLIEEFSEFQSSKIEYIFYGKKDKDAVIDAVGDTLVCCSAVLDILRALTGKPISLQRIIGKVSKNQETKRFDELTLKVSQETLKLKYEDLMKTISEIIVYLCKESNVIGLNVIEDDVVFLEHCLEVAFNVIKDRTGKNVNGNFIKSEDLQ